jgi:hypothetical protein
MDRDFTHELASFRDAAIKMGIITAAQAEGIRFSLLSAEEAKAIQAAADNPLSPVEGVSMCRCENCQQSKQFFAIEIDQQTISAVQAKILFALYSTGVESLLGMKARLDAPNKDMN